MHGFFRKKMVRTERASRTHCTHVRLWIRFAGSCLAVLAVPISTAWATPPAPAPAVAGTFGYAAPPECPTREDFSAEVLARTKSWLAPSSPFAVTVTIERGTDGLVGRVTFERGGKLTERELRAAGCTELVQALSLIVAILIDPQVQNPPLPHDAAARPPPVYLMAAPAPAPPAPGPSFVGGVEASLQTTLIGSPTLGPRVFLGLDRGAHSIWASSVRLSYTHLGGHLLSPASGARADFTLDTGRLDGCPLRVGEDGLAFESCLFLDVGRLKATGLHASGDVARLEPWAAFGLSFRPSWTLARRLVLDAALGLALPITHYRFAFTGEPTLTETPACGLDAALGIGVRFP